MTVANPRFPRQGRQPQGRGTNLLLGEIFVKICVKKERNWTKEWRVHPLDPLIAVVQCMMKSDTISGLIEIEL